MNNDQEQQRLADMQAFAEEIDRLAQSLPGYKAKEFTFSNLEQQLLAEQQTIIALAGQTQNRVINEHVLRRVGVEPSPAIHVRYSIGLGRFVVFTPSQRKKAAVENTQNSPRKRRNTK